MQDIIEDRWVGVEERGIGLRKKDIFEENKELQSSLFLAQSYQDAWADYGRSLKKERFARWDYVVLTACTEVRGNMCRN